MLHQEPWDIFSYILQISQLQKSQFTAPAAPEKDESTTDESKEHQGRL